MFVAAGTPGSYAEAASRAPPSEPAPGVAGDAEWQAKLWRSDILVHFTPYLRANHPEILQRLVLGIDAQPAGLGATNREATDDAPIAIGVAPERLAALRKLDDAVVFVSAHPQYEATLRTYAQALRTSLAAPRERMRAPLSFDSYASIPPAEFARALESRQMQAVRKRLLRDAMAMAYAHQIGHAVQDAHADSADATAQAAADTFAFHLIAATSSDDASDTDTAQMPAFILFATLDTPPSNATGDARTDPLQCRLGNFARLERDAR